MPEMNNYANLRAKPLVLIRTPPTDETLTSVMVCSVALLAAELLRQGDVELHIDHAQRAVAQLLQRLRDGHRDHAGSDLRFSYEPDYRSIFLTGRGEIDLASRNTTLGLLAGFGHDSLSNAGAQGGISERIEGTLTTMLASASLSQVLTRTMVAGLTYDLAQT